MTAEITSRKNELVRQYMNFSSSSRKRREEHCFSVEGARLCADAATSGLKIRMLLVTKEAEEKYGVYLHSIRESCRMEYKISDSVAKYLSKTKSPQGIFCICSMPTEKGKFPAVTTGSCLTVLENIQDPANLGAVLRTAEALGINGVLLGGSCCDIYSPKVLRSSMGAVFRLPIFIFPDTSEAINHLNDLGFQTFAAVPDAAAEPVTAVCFSGEPSAVAIGNEGNGLTEKTKRACGHRVTIPMRGRAESLNAAASAAILMWEMTRRDDCPE
jgi:TrmH family RNA methyltransferase